MVLKAIARKNKDNTNIQMCISKYPLNIKLFYFSGSVGKMEYN